MDTLLQDIRFGVRLLRRSPGFTTAAVLALALGVGSTTAVFTLLDRVVLRPLPYPDPDRLTMIWETIAPPPTLHEVVGGDHSFKLTGRDPAKQAAMHSGIQRTIADWIRLTASTRAGER